MSVTVKQFESYVTSRFPALEYTLAFHGGVVDIELKSTVDDFVTELRFPFDGKKIALGLCDDIGRPIWRAWTPPMPGGFAAMSLMAQDWDDLRAAMERFRHDDVTTIEAYGRPWKASHLEVIVSDAHYDIKWKMVASARDNNGLPNWVARQQVPALMTKFEIGAKALIAAWKKEGSPLGDVKAREVKIAAQSLGAIKRALQVDAAVMRRVTR